MWCFAAGVAAAAAELGVGVAVAASAAAADFFECFFLAGVAEASGVGLGTVSAARTSGMAVKAAIRMRVIKERMLVLLENLSAFGKIFIAARFASPGHHETAKSGYY